MVAGPVIVARSLFFISIVRSLGSAAVPDCRWQEHVPSVWRVLYQGTCMRLGYWIIILVGLTGHGLWA
jgi:hypothetical protein